MKTVDPAAVMTPKIPWRVGVVQCGVSLDGVRIRQGAADAEQEAGGREDGDRQHERFADLLKLLEHDDCSHFGV
ncbi:MULTISPECIES: hypothetical protein [unclassified Arthrobacter]|uniref:hypothetical protein n=1 Tax=unclassified Arthrobacter TaxID=235627 RepID=UPI0033929657